MLNLLVKLNEKLVVWFNIFFREQKTTKQQKILSLRSEMCFTYFHPQPWTLCKFLVSLMLVPWVDRLMSFWWVTFCVLFWRCQWLLAGAMTTKVRRHDKRIHPYQRVVTTDRAATATNPWPLDLLTFPSTDDPPISARWRAHWPAAPPLPQAQPTRDQNIGSNPAASV